jgi:hypothetical protein
MTTKIFINWEDRDVLTETAYKAKVAEAKSDEINFDDYKDDFLKDEIEDYIKYTLHKIPNAENIFNLTDKDRKNILDNLRKNYEKSIEDDMETDWEEFEIEV